MEKQPSLELKAMGNTPGAAAPAPPWENPEYVYAEDDYDMNYDESLPSHVSVDSVSEDEDDSVDGAGTKPKSRKRKKDIPMSPEAKRKRPRGTEVGRANELLKPNEIIEQIDSRSVAASPLPHNVKLEDVQSFSAQHGNVNNVRLPKHVSDKRHFCGTALVEFSEEEEANSVTEKKLSFAGADLELKPKKEFDTEREAKQEAYEKSNANKNGRDGGKEFDTEREAEQEAYEKSNANKNGRDGGYPEGLILAFKLKKILADVDPEQIVGDKVDDTDTAKKEGASSSAEESAIGHEEEVPENADVREERSDDVEESNAADAHSLNKDGKSPLENDKQTITREDFKEYFAKFGTVRYVDFSKGDDSGYLRFEESKAAEKAHALAALSVEGGLIMKGYLVTLEPVPQSSHKDRLQKFSLKKYQKYPVYVTRSEGESCDCKFWCTIEVDGQQFKSVHLHVRKKEAEQDAAKVAYEFLMARNGDNFTDVLELIDKDLLLCKTILYEFSSKKKAGQPSYSYHRQKGGRMSFFAATVCIAGKEYTGGIAKSKNAAAEKAARLAVKSILDTNDVCMLKIFRSKRRSVTATLSKKRTLKTSAPNLEAPGQTVGRVDVQFQHPGTTCSTVLTQAILTELCKAVAAGVNVMDLGKGINKAINAVTAHLKSKAWMIDSPEEINQVATIYANGEKEIGDLISKAMGIVGKDGVITIVDGKTLNNELEAVQGMKMSRGYISPYFVTDQKTQKCEMENPLILIHDKKISNMNSLLPILQISIKERRPLLIFADIEGEALSILVLNKHRAGLKICAVKAPGFGENRRANLDDLAVLTGGQVVSEDQGLDLSKVEFQMLGTAKKVTVSLDDIIILDCGGDKLQIEERCQQLRESFENSTAVFDKEKAQERLAKLSGGVAVLKIGGASEAEVGEKKDRVTDALNAARAAVKEGIVPGGGVALLYATKELDKISTSHEDEKIGVQIIKNALKAPLMTIAANAGVDGSVVIGKLLEQDNLSLGYDAAKEEYVDMIKAGIIDPVKVIRTALQDAASVSLLMATTEAAVAELPATKARIASRMPDMRGMGF